MIPLYLPEKFVNKVSYNEVVNDKLVVREKTVTSETAPIIVDWSGPLVTSFTKEAVAKKKQLMLAPGQTADFTEEEAVFLLERYPFLERKDENISLGGMPRKAETMTPMEEVKVKEESTPGALPLKVVNEALPTNFMQLKKYAISKGANILLTDKKEDILQKLQALNP